MSTVNKMAVNDNFSLNGELEAGICTITKSNLSSSTTIPRKYKILFLTAGVVSTIAVCTAITIIAIRLSLTLRLIHDHTQSLDEYGMEHKGNLLESGMWINDEQLIMDVSSYTCTI